jgi:hypothetical protein
MISKKEQLLPLSIICICRINVHEHTSYLGRFFTDGPIILFWGTPKDKLTKKTKDKLILAKLATEEIYQFSHLFNLFCASSTCNQRTN